MHDDAPPWPTTTATIVDFCEKQEWPPVARGDLIEIYPVEIYTVHFEYIVDGSPFSGSYETSEPPVLGSDFELAYDPRHPERNTMSESPVKRRDRIFAVCAGILAGLLWLWWKK